MTKENKTIVEMLVCAALWSIAGVLMKFIPWNGFAVAGMRSLIAGATIFIYTRIKHYKLVVSKKTLLCGFFTGLLYTCFAVSNKLTTAANAIVLQFTSPVFVILISAVFLKTKIRKRDFIVVLFTLTGISLFFRDQLGPGYMLGNIIAILAGVFMAAMFVIVGNLEGEARFSGIIFGQLFTFLIGLPFIIITKPVFDTTSVIFILILGIFQLGIAYILYVKSSRYCPPLACCLLGALEPLLNPVWVAIFYGEMPGIFAIIGAAIVIISITVWCVVDSISDKSKAETDA